MVFKKMIVLNRIGSKMAFFTMLSIVVILSVSAYYENYNDRENMQIEMIQKLDSLLAMSQSALANPLWDYDSEAINDYGDSLFVDEEVFYVTITDDLLGEAYIRKRIDKANDDFDLFNDKRDIYYLKQKIGAIEIGLNGDIKRAQIKERFNKRIYEIWISILVLFSIISYITKTITKPLKRTR